MADVGDNIVRRYIYRGEEGEVIDPQATHITVAENVIVVRANAFKRHRNIIELVCHSHVGKIEFGAFWGCPSLRRVIMPGVKILERYAFYSCPALTDVECGKLEIIGGYAFGHCESLRSINLPSARIVGVGASLRRGINLPATSIEEGSVFTDCEALMDVKFGSKLETIEGRVFEDCASLERITIPLKDGLIAARDIFTDCENLRHVDLVEREELQETIAALQLEEWRNDMNEVIDSINETLRYIPTGIGVFDPEENDLAIRMWIRSVLYKIIDYKAEHRRVLDEEVAPILQFALPREIVVNNVLSFLALPSYPFEGEDV